MSLLDKNFETSDYEDAFEYYFFDGCYTGDFLTKLFQCIQVANFKNLRRLERAFPIHVAAFRLWSNVSKESLLKKIPDNHPLKKKVQGYFDIKPS